ncbi:MAG TPA: DUF58 domain-containing protein [Thermoanaerobaculia bacterium]|nr:DUF58 domain-containing protein [Thermoanaerobaculia bacterium]
MFGFLSPRRSQSGGAPPATAAPPAPSTLLAAPAAAGKRARIPFELLRKVRRIEIATNRLVDQGVAGDYHSVFKGRGMEFAEVRPYQPGDDVRGIDWNVTARMGSPFVKQFVEERDLTIFLVVDVSGSLSFGSRAILKRELAAEIAALLAFAAVRNQDRVGAALISDRLELFLPPQRRRNHVLRLVREILERPAHGATDLERGLLAVLATLKRRSVLFLISDFLGTPASRALKAAAARHDLILIEVMDPRDQELPAVGPVVLRDAETGEIALIDGRRLGRRHRERRQQERAELLRLSRRLSIDRLELRTDRPYLSTLLAFFEQRRRRLRR